ncbi:MAG: hypothetical protein IT269_02700, partial [Saprospiraceae bacterium]|nr:hypothetical protein [Saprospiraceae bacterium]
MGVIQRQSLKYSAVNLIGLCVGAISTLFVYPHALEAYGLVQMMLTTGIVALPILAFGANTVAIRFFPRFEDKTQDHHGFLPLLLLLCGIGCLIGAVLGMSFWPAFEARFSNNPLAQQYLWMAGPMAALCAVSTVLLVYCSNFKRIVVPSLIFDFSMKLAVPLLLIGVWQQWWTLPTALWGLMAHWSLILVGLIAYLKWLGEWRWKPDWTYLTPSLRREIGMFILFGAFGALALQLATRADTLFVGGLKDVRSAGIYNIAAYIAAAIDIPTKGLYGASASFVAKYLAEEKFEELGDLYRRVSINLLAAGLLLFGCAWVSVDSLFQVVPNGQEIAAGKYVLLFIGLSRIVEMGSGLNHYLVYYSKHYLWSLVALAVLAVCTISMNVYLVPIYGLNGTAIAT